MSQGYVGGVIVLGPIYIAGDPIYGYLSDLGVISKQIGPEKLVVAKNPCQFLKFG